MPDLGDALPFSAKLYSAPPDQGGELVDALTAVLTITLPNGTTLTPSIPDPASVGVYQYNYSSTMAGRHVGRWLFTFFGGATTAYVETFDVRPADPGYILSLAEAKAALNIPITHTADDEDIRSLSEAVTRVIEDYRKEAVVRRTVTERLTAQSSRSILLGTAPIISLTSISSNGYTYPPTDLEIADATTGQVNTTGASFTGDLDAVYVVGQPVIPANYTEAAKIILKHLWQTQQAPGMGSRVFGGGEDISVGIAGMGYAIPNRAAELLGGRGVVVA